jgi:hypothetical protein
MKENKAIAVLIPLVRPMIEKIVLFEAAADNFDDFAAQITEVKSFALEEIKSKKSKSALSKEGRLYLDFLIDLENATKKLTSEEKAKEDEEITQELIAQDSRMVAVLIWECVVYDGVNRFRKSGEQIMELADFVAELPIIITNPYCTENDYPEIRRILAEAIPQMFERSFMGKIYNDYHVDTKYMEMLYLESTGQIVLREVSEEMFQTWVNS